MDDFIELRRAINIVLRRWWMLVILIALTTTFGYAISERQTPVYEATTKILVSKDLSDQNSQFAGMSIQQIIDANIQLLSSADVVDEVSRQLDTKIDIKNVAQIQQVRSTPVIQIAIKDSNPQRAANIANMLVEVLIDQNTQASGYAATEASLKNQISQIEDQISTLQIQFDQLSDEKLQSQLKQVNEQITTLQGEISKLSTEIGPLTSLSFPTAGQSVQLAEKQAQLAQLQSLLSQYQQIRINLEYFGKSALSSSDQEGDLRLQLLQSTLEHYQTIYLDLLDDLQTVQRAHLRNTSTIEQIEKAAPPAEPVRPRPLIYSMLAGIVGLVLAIGIVFIIEYMDDTLKTPEEIGEEIGLPVIGFIGDTRGSGEKENGIFVSRHPRSPITEAYRSLRANLEFAGVDRTLKTILVTSCETGIGKSSISTNLAIVIAQSERNVILVDADLRKSSIHNLIGLPNNTGLSDVFRNKIELADALQGWEDERVKVITSGTSPPNPAELLGSKKMDEILATLEEIADVVIIDSPPFVVSDALPLSAKVDGVLIVMQPGVTRKKFTQEMMAQLNRAGARVVGVVLNRIPHKGPDYYGDYQYYPPYRSNGHYLSEEDVGAQGKASGRKLRTAVKKFLPSVNPGSIKQRVSEIRRRIRISIKNRGGPPEYITGYPGQSDQEIFNIKGAKD